MKQIFAALFFSLAFCFCSVAQLSFVRVDTVQVIDDSLPLKNAWAGGLIGGLNFPMFEPIDLNGDGIMDLVVYEQGFLPGHYHLMPFLNLGDSGMVDYHFAPQYISSFPFINSWLITYDYNCDGKNDLFCLSNDCSCGIMVYRNDYSNAGGLQFTKILNDSGQDYLLANYNGTLNTNIPANSVSIPAILDVDGDGAMDVIGWAYYCVSTLSYFHGVDADNRWSCDSLNFNWVTDSWGHFNFVAGSNSAALGITCGRMASDSTLLWDRGTAPQDDTQSCVCLYEQDGTIRKDVLGGGYQDANVLYLHNGGVLNDSMDYENNWPGYNVPDNLNSFPCAYNLDVDNDNKKDMIVAPHSVNDWRGVQYYKNVDIANDTPIFVRQPHTFLQEEMIDVGTAAAPQFFDYDCDGLPDLLIGDLSYTDTTGAVNKGIALYKNIGTSSAPKFKLITRDFAGLNELNGLTGTFCSTFGDLNNDGYIDMIVGSSGSGIGGSGDGKLYYFQNNGCPASFTSPTGNYMGIDVGSASVPQLYDLNHDDKLDLIVGNYFGLIKYYMNRGTASSPFFLSTPDKDTLGGIITQLPQYLAGYASPVFYNDSGTDKLIVGTNNGKVYVYDNINGNIFGTYHLADSLINGEDGQNLIPAIGDINNDGHPDMIIGNYSGGVSLYMNSFTTGINELHKTVYPSFDAYPNPASDELHLDFYHLENTQAQLEILNCIGQIVYKSAVNGEKMNITLKNFTNGIYIAHFVNADNAQSIKIVVRH